MKKKALVCVALSSIMCATAAIALTACGEKKKYHVNYEGGGQVTYTGDLPTEGDHAKSDKFKVKDWTYECATHTFEGWKYDGKTYSPNDDFTMPAKDVTFTAVWESISYTVSFTYGETLEGLTLPTDVKVEKGAQLDLSEHKVTLGSALSDYSFIAWSDGTNTYEAEEPIVVNGDITLEAIIRKNVQISDSVELKATYLGEKPMEEGGGSKFETDSDVDAWGAWYKEISVTLLQSGWFTIYVESGDLSVYLTDNVADDEEPCATASNALLFNKDAGTYTFYIAGGAPEHSQVGDKDTASVRYTIIKGGTVTVKYYNTINSYDPIKTETLEAGAALGTLPETPSQVPEEYVPSTAYEFGGWGIPGERGENGIEYTTVSAETEATSDLQIYAIWNPKSFNVTCDYGDHANETAPTEGDAMSKKYGSEVKLADLTSKDSGFVFGGWTVTLTEGGDAVDFSLGSFLMPAGNVTVTATWLDANNVWTVSFYANKTADTPIGTKSVLKVTEGAAKLPDSNFIAVPDVDKLTSDGWVTADGTLFTSNSEITGDISVYAHYVVTITYEGGDQHAAALTTAKAEIDEDNVTLPAGPTSDSEHYEFAGWLVGEDETPKAAGTTITLSENTTITAKWTAKDYGITYVYGEYATAPDGTTAKYGSTVTLTAPESNNEQYAFDGWEVKQGETTVTVTDNTFTMPGGAVTVTAKWERKYTVNVYLSEGDTEAARTLYVKSGEAINTVLSEAEINGLKAQKGINEFKTADGTAVDATTVVSELVSDGYELKVYAKYSIVITNGVYSLSPKWTTTLEKGEVITLKGTQGTEGAAAKTGNYQSAVLYLFTPNPNDNIPTATDAIRSDWCVNVASGKTWANDGKGNLADNSAITALVGPSAWDAPWWAHIADCDITIVADWSSETVIYLAMTFTKDSKTERMIYVVQPTKNAYTFGIGTDNNSLNITDVKWRADETVASQNQTSFEIGTSDCTLGYTAFNPLWVSEQVNAGDKLEIAGNLTMSTAETYKVPIVNLMQNNYSFALWRIDEWLNGITWYVNSDSNAVKCGDNFNAKSWGTTDATVSGTYTLTFDWTNTNSLVITFEVTINSEMKSNTLTLTEPNVDNFNFGLGGEGIYMTGTSITYTPATPAD